MLKAHGFWRVEHNVWHTSTFPALAWNTVMLLRFISPRGIFESVIQELDLFPVYAPVVLARFRLGDPTSLPVYLDSTAAGLAPVNVLSALPSPVAPEQQE